jgi:OmpA family
MVKQSIKTCKIIGTASLFAVTVLGSAMAQDTPQAAPPTPAAQSAPATPAATPATATGQPPLEGQSKEGFWGHMNPFARKKWVARQVDPIRDRTNELDELEAKNANDIKDVDARATAGISKAMAAAGAADQHAADASGRADAANSVAVTANTRTSALNGTVSNLDQYQQVTATTVAFAPGRTALGPQGKASLDDLSSQLANQKGYIIEVQAYSRAGVPASQAEADSVVRYLVEAHQVPVYRIYKTGLGKQTPDQIAALAQPASNSTADATTSASATPDEKPVLNGVRVTILHNSLATMDNQSGSQSGASSAKGGDQQ